MNIDYDVLDRIIDGDFNSPAEIPAEYVDDYEERAGILEFDGGMNRNDAERQAKDEILRRIGKI